MIPRQTMLIELSIAVLKNSPNKDAANAFIRYLKSHAGAGAVRPERVPAGEQAGGGQAVQKQFPARPGMFTINDKMIGGWRAADKKWFDPNNGLMAKIEQSRRRADLWQLSRRRGAAPRGAA